LFRDCLDQKGFIEIHTPKIINGKWLKKNIENNI
jgi:aspartyl/asparaginyl-tRNA synthetase